MKKNLICALCLLSFLGILSGCAKQEQASAGPIDTTKTQESEFQKVGTKSLEYVFFQNQTGKRIKQIKIRKSGKKSWSKNLLKKNQKIAQKEKVQLYLPNIKENQNIDLKVTYDNGKDNTLSKISTKDTKSICMYRNSHYAYVEYVSMNEKQIASTKAAEKKAWEKQEAEKKAAEEAAKQAAAEEAARQAAAEAAASQAASSSHTSSSHSGSSNSNRQEENCAESGNSGSYVDDGNGGWTWVPN